MPNAAHGQSPQIAHVSITLDDVNPEVSRIVAVPLGTHLDMLHLVIQAAMGWTNTHLCCSRPAGAAGCDGSDFDGPSNAGRASLIDMIADIGTSRFSAFLTLVTTGAARSRSLSQCLLCPASPIHC